MTRRDSLSKCVSMKGNGQVFALVGRREREREREGQRESKRADFRNVLARISGTSWNWNARLVPSESASKGEKDRVLSVEGGC